MVALNVLLVDDDESVVRAITRILVRAGHAVIGCSSFQSALAELGRSERPIDAVVTDLHLNDGDGADLVREIRQRRPSTSVIILSGDEIATHGDLPARALAKPVRSTQLLKILVEETEPSK